MFLKPTRRFFESFVCVALVVCLSCCSTSQPQPRQKPSRTVYQPTYLNDPTEPLNRGIWEVNRVAILGLVDPISKTYRGIVPRKVRSSVTNVASNLLYPGRLINEGLQGRWHDAGDDSLRFLTNSTVGVGGIFDVASHWGMPKPRADFSQTFQSWGWQPETYIMLPLLGPSDQSSATARVLNEASDPLNYIDAIRPINITLSGHRLSEQNDPIVRVIRREADPYSISHLAWSYYSLRKPQDWVLHEKPDLPSLETLGAVSIKFENPQFPNSLRTGRVKIPRTGKRLPFTYHMQRTPAPLVFVVPGIGAHRLSDTSLVLAEHLYASGYSVATVSSTFHPEFMEKASSSTMPGHLKQDLEDLWTTMRLIDHYLSFRYKERITSRAMVGASLGGYMALQFAAAPPTDPSFGIDRFIAIDPPVDLPHAVKMIDEFQRTPEVWSASTRQSKIDNTLHKLAVVAIAPPGSLKDPPFSGIESKFLIGLNFRLLMRDALFSIEKRHKIGLTDSPISYWYRQDAYRELNEYSFSDYAYEIMIPHFLAKGISKGEFERAKSLRAISGRLANAIDARVITNRNDFLLRPTDLVWLRSTFGNSRLSILPSGGHLGNVGSSEVRRELVKHLKELE